VAAWAVALVRLTAEEALCSPGLLKSSLERRITLSERTGKGHSRTHCKPGPIPQPFRLWRSHVENPFCQHDNALGQ
jgi:hypothetical protein